MEEIIKELREVAARCDLDDGYDLNDCAEDIREIAGRLEKAVAPCNQLKMREALKYLKEASREFCHLILNSKYIAIMDKYKCPEVAKIRDAIANAGLVLAEPPRNCDVGTWKEQGKRFWAYCKQFLKSQGMCINCPLYKGTNSIEQCLCKWGQMPYKKREME